MALAAGARLLQSMTGFTSMKRLESAGLPPSPVSRLRHDNSRGSPVARAAATAAMRSNTFARSPGGSPLASDRKRAVEGTSGSVRVHMGGRLHSKIKNTNIQKSPNDTYI